MTPAQAQSTYWALQEDASFAALGDTTRNYGFVTVRSVNLTCETATALSFNRKLISACFRAGPLRRLWLEVAAHQCALRQF